MWGMTITQNKKLHSSWVLNFELSNGGLAYGASTKQEVFGGIFSKVSSLKLFQQPESLDYAIET